MSKNILVPTDGSQHSMKAVATALEKAQKDGAKVTLISVAYYSREDFDELPPDIQEKLEAQARDALKKSKKLFEDCDVPVEVVLQAGFVPANNIIETAQKGNFDEIVMGSTGLTGLSRILIGSTAAKVAANAPCCVSIIR